MKLYTNPMSPNVRRVRLTAAVLGLQLEEKKLDFAKGEQKNPEYLALNPNGAVPTLVDGDFVLTESRAIMQYLASKKPEMGLLPRDEQVRADVTRWQFWDSSHFSPQIGTVVFQRILKPMMGMGQLPPFRRRIEQASRRQAVRRRRLHDARGPHTRLFAHVRQAGGSAACRVPEHPSVVLAHQRHGRLEEDEPLSDDWIFSLRLPHNKAAAPWDR
jgi:glutathione S-transferase